MAAEESNAPKLRAGTGRDLYALGLTVLRICEKHLAVLSLFLVAASYLHLLIYARHEGIPLRIHYGSMLSLLPWLLLNGALVAAWIAFCVAIPAALGAVPTKGGKPLLDVVWAKSDSEPKVTWRAFCAWILVVATPLALGVAVMTALAIFDVLDDRSFLLGCLLLPILTGLGLTIAAVRRSNDSLTVIGAAIYGVLVAVGQSMFGLALFLVSQQVASNLRFTSTPTSLAVLLFVLWTMLSGLGFCFWLARRGLSRRDAKRVLRFVLLAIPGLALSPPASVMLTRSSLDMLGLGGTVIQVAVDPQRLRADSEAWSVPYQVLLDMGDTMLVRTCSSRTVRREFETLAWADIHAVKRTGCPPLVPDGVREGAD